MPCGERGERGGHGTGGGGGGAVLGAIDRLERHVHGVLLIERDELDEGEFHECDDGGERADGAGGVLA